MTDDQDLQNIIMGNMRMLRKEERGKIQVYEKRCNQCLFSDAKVVEDHRAELMLKELQGTNTHFICHKSTIHDNGVVCCRGFWDANKDRVLKLILADKLGLVEFIPIPEPKY